jgi:hypothetical protein
VAAGRYGVVILSRDGVHWEQASVGTEPLLDSVAFGNGHFLIGGWFGAILQSGPVVGLTLQSDANGQFSRFDRSSGRPNLQAPVLSEPEVLAGRNDDHRKSFG